MALVETTVDGRLGWIVFNRPEKLNAFTPQLFAEFDAALAALGEDERVRVILIRGEGRAFSAGWDVNAEAEDVKQTGRVYALDDAIHLRGIAERWLSVWRCPKPVIAAVHGYCMGLATPLVVCCDLTVVADDARIGWPSLPLGGGLLAVVSAWLIGPKKAKELSFIAGSGFSGVEAAEMGWANYAVPAAEVVAKATALAERIAKTPPDLLRLKKLAVNRVMDVQGFSEAVTFGAEWDAVAHDSRGMAEIGAKVRELGLKEAIAWFEREG